MVEIKKKKNLNVLLIRKEKSEGSDFDSSHTDEGARFCLKFIPCHFISLSFISLETTLSHVFLNVQCICNDFGEWQCFTANNSKRFHFFYYCWIGQPGCQRPLRVSGRDFFPLLLSFKISFSCCLIAAAVCFRHLFILWNTLKALEYPVTNSEWKGLQCL